MPYTFSTPDDIWAVRRLMLDRKFDVKQILQTYERHSGIEPDHLDSIVDLVDLILTAEEETFQIMRTDAKRRRGLRCGLVKS